MHFKRKTQMLFDKYTMFEGEIDRLNRPHGYGCCVKFNHSIKGKCIRGTHNKKFAWIRVKLTSVARSRTVRRRVRLWEQAGPGPADISERGHLLWRFHDCSLTRIESQDLVGIQWPMDGAIRGTGSKARCTGLGPLNGRMDGCIKVVI